jgi:hypothetical protein
VEEGSLVMSWCVLLRPVSTQRPTVVLGVFHKLGLQDCGHCGFCTDHWPWEGTAAIPRPFKYYLPPSPLDLHRLWLWFPSDPPSPRPEHGRMPVTEGSASLPPLGEVTGSWGPFNTAWLLRPCLRPALQP